MTACETTKGLFAYARNKMSSRSRSPARVGMKSRLISSCSGVYQDFFTSVYRSDDPVKATSPMQSFDGVVLEELEM